MNGTTITWGLIFIFFLRFWTCNLWGSLIWRGRRPLLSSNGCQWICVIGRLKWWPLRTSFLWIISFLIIFYSDDKTPNANSAPSVVWASSSSIELEDDDSYIFVTKFIFRGLKCVGAFLGVTVTGEGDGSLKITWPCLYVDCSLNCQLEGLRSASFFD